MKILSQNLTAAEVKSGRRSLAHIPVDYFRLVLTKNFQKHMHNKWTWTRKNRKKILMGYRRKVEKITEIYWNVSRQILDRRYSWSLSGSRRCEFGEFSVSGSLAIWRRTLTKICVKCCPSDQGLLRRRTPCGLDDPLFLREAVMSSIQWFSSKGADLTRSKTDCKL